MLLTLAFLVSTACSVPFDAVTAAADVSTRPTSIVIASVPSLAVGQTTKLTTVVKDAEGRVLPDMSIAWGNSAPAVASIIADGTVTALSAGTVTFTAVSGPAQASVTITVAAAPVTPPTTPTPPTPGTSTPAQLPMASVETAMPAAPAAGGTVISVSATGDLQAAIDQAKPGDVIELAAGAVYTGHFILPNKGSGSEWIVIRPAAGVALPPAGTRMTPQLAAASRLPKIVGDWAGYAIGTALAAHHYRLVGIEITALNTLSQNYGLVGLGTDRSDGQTSLPSVAHHLVLDRLYVHGTPTLPVRRCIALNAATAAVIDSYVSDCHDLGADAQAIAGWNGPGPFLIENNYLEASSENVMFGGSDAAAAALMPADITIRRNHITKPLAWKGGSWVIKTLLELKVGKRVLIEGNVLEGNWAHAWSGEAVGMKSVNQDDTAPWSETGDVTMRLNLIRNVGAGFNIAGRQGTHTAVNLNRLWITNNLLTQINTADYNGSRRLFFVADGTVDLTISHNTVANATGVWLGVLILDGDPSTRFVFRDNVAASTEVWTILGPGVGPIDAVRQYAPAGVVAGNVFAYVSGSPDYLASHNPPNNLYLPSVAAVGFADFAAGDFRLAVTSPAKGTATDGTDPGADVAAVLAATRGVVIP
jgi:hypothetical protein